MDEHKLNELKSYISTKWQQSIIPTLVEYIKIPCKSPAFDANWEQNKFIQKSVDLFKAWVIEQKLENLNLEVVTLPGRTPLLYIEIAAYKNNSQDTQDTILLYGHLDKQPEMTGWDQDKAPWTPIIIDNKLYGRGGADDGYALFASITAIKALQNSQLSHPRCIIMIEACEESGSHDLPFYVEHLKTKIQNPSLVICLDSACGNFEQFWLTTSLRGNIRGVLNVEITKEGVHSGAASGIIPSSFRIIRLLLDRLEDPITGEIIPDDFYVEIPAVRIKEAQLTAEILSDTIYSEFPFLENVKPVTGDHIELLLNKTWRPQLEITGAGGLPQLESAGNVLRPKTSLMLSMRIPPDADSQKCFASLKQILEHAPPYNAKVTFESSDASSGWNSPEIAPWLKQAVDEASIKVFNKPSAFWGEGGTIPFMGMLGKQFPDAQFVITGVLGPKSNAHGPNEFLHLTMAEKLTVCVAYIINKKMQA